MITRRKFIATLAGAGLGAIAARAWSADTPFPEACVVRGTRVPAPGPWRGKSALFLSDLHCGHYFGPAEAAALNAIVRGRKPDLVLMGGDFADTPGTDLSGFLSLWSPGCPTFFAPGNHDVAPDHSTSPVLRQAMEGGMRVLCNAAEAWDGITFVGLPSAFRGTADRSLLEGDGLKIVLAHEPDTWDAYGQPDLLQLGGHTHGGQVRVLGRPLVLPMLGRKYVQGCFSRDRNNSLIVSAGIGCMGPHVRINCPPEIVELQFV